MLNESSFSRENFCGSTQSESFFHYNKRVKSLGLQEKKNFKIQSMYRQDCFLTLLAWLLHVHIQYGGKPECI